MEKYDSPSHLEAGRLAPSSSSSSSHPDGHFPYTLSRWTAVDDRVRGGSSISHLDPVKGGGARFWGTLDTQTLGGAGFASQSYTFTKPLSLPISLYTGLLVQLLPRPEPPVREEKAEADPEKVGGPAKPTKITVVLKTEMPEKRKDGRNEAVVSWEAEFDLEEVYGKARAGAGESEKLSARPGQTSPSPSLPPQTRLPWSSFTPTYRGRPVPPSSPPHRLDPSEIVTLSLMCRSNFAQQEGDFECRVRSIEGIERSEWSKAQGRKRGVREMGWGEWFWGLFLRLFGR